MNVRWPMLLMTNRIAESIAKTYEAEVGATAMVWLCGRAVLHATDVDERKEERQREAATKEGV